MMDCEIVRDALQAGPDCPELEFLVYELKLAPDAPMRILAERHLSLCAHCRTELALLKNFHESPFPADNQSQIGWIQARLASGRLVEDGAWLDASGRRRWKRFWIRIMPLAILAAAAALLIARR